jgi:hypothetical protein
VQVPVVGASQGDSHYGVPVVLHWVTDVFAGGSSNVQLDLMWQNKDHKPLILGRAARRTARGGVARRRLSRRQVGSMLNIQCDFNNF